MCALRRVRSARDAHDAQEGGGISRMATKTTKRKESRLQRGSSVTKAFQQLRELIVRGHLSPGSWIVEADLVDRLGLSRTPIRGALQWLHREGYVVEHKVNRKARMFVAPLTSEDARELYLLVGRLETLAGSLIASLSPAARTKLADQLAAINSRLNDIASQRPADPRRVFDLDKDFHTKLVGASAGPRLIALHRAVTPQVERYWRLYASSIISELHVSVAEHNEIIRAIRSGDATAIEQAVNRNWTGGFERISRLIEVFGERGSW
jgi:DNA-binding GntR family transcriptional regulator